jgi:pimeloyl-ACP methyl ester carboxylesterase
MVTVNISRRVTAVLGAAVLLVLSPIPASASPPTLRWTACHGEFQCATAKVPLDFRRPGGARIELAVIRHRATDSAHRLGSLFVNGGGPGPQVDPIVAQYGRIPAAWRARYDIVGFDPRGFGRSTAVRCFDSVETENAFLAELPAIAPRTPKEIAEWDRTWARFDARCARTNGALLRHDSTADVARDMELLRRALGDPVLNYLGLSYGTGLGATYANLFPGTVGRMVLDGNLDPVAWTRGDGPLFTRTGADRATGDALDSLLDVCGRTPTCAFSAGTPAATHAKFDALLRRLHGHPGTVDGVSCDDLCAAVQLPLSNVDELKDAADRLQRLWEGDTTGAPPVRAQAELPPYTGQEQTNAVLCSDVADPRDPRAYTAAARRSLARSGLAGLTWVWATESCARWPVGRDAYTGPWNRRTANPILLVGNTHDPATPYAGSVAMARALARARLLTVDGYGHTELSNPSRCAGAYEDRYLLTGALPRAGTVCAQDTVPFG